MKKIILFLSSILALASCSCQEKKEFGIQLYSVRSLIGNPELFAQNHDAVLKSLSEYGYTSVEPACYSDGKLYGLDPQEFRLIVESYGMTVISTHVGHNLSPEAVETGDFSAELEWWKQCIECHKIAGCKYIVMPSMPFPQTIDFLQRYCEYYNAIGKLCTENGIRFGYHNHSNEFKKIEDTEVWYDYMLQHTDPQYVFFQMDVYWAMRGNAAPVEYFKKYPGRFALLHIKDDAEVGQSGMVGFDAIFNNFDLSGTEDYIVEMEKSNVGDIMETCRISAEYLKNSPFVK